LRDRASAIKQRDASRAYVFVCRAFDATSHARTEHFGPNPADERRMNGIKSRNRHRTVNRFMGAARPIAERQKFAPREKTPEERVMFTKIRNTVLALAAVASLGIASLAVTTTSADARGFGGGGFSRGGGGGHIGMRMGGMRHIGGVHRIGRVHHIGHRIRIAQHRPHFRPHFHPRPHWCHRFPWRCKVHVRWPRPIIYGAPVVAAAAYSVAPAAAAPRCTCLTKEYTQEGLTVFRDVCTKEIASAPTGTTALPAAPDSTTMAPQTELQQPMQPQVR